MNAATAVQNGLRSRRVIENLSCPETFFISALKAFQQVLSKEAIFLRSIMAKNPPPYAT
jgi:hypothetical protein